MEYNIAWKTTEKAKNKSTDWYWALIIISISLLALAIILKNYLFGILVIVGFLAIILQIKTAPKIIRVGINEKGIRVENHFYPYRNLSSFYIDDKTLILHTKHITPAIFLPLGETDETELVEFLSEFLPEHEEEERSVIEAIVNRLGF